MAFLIPAGIIAAETATAAATAAAAAAAATEVGVAGGLAASATLVGAEAAATAAVEGLGTSALSSLVSNLPTFLNVALSGGQLLSGISERMSEAAQRRTEAKQLEDLSRRKAQIEFQKSIDVNAKATTVANAAGIESTSGSPLSIMIDNLQRGVLNARDVQYEGTVGANARKAEARQLTDPWSFVGMGVGVLSDFYKRSRYLS